MSDVTPPLNLSVSYGGLCRPKGAAPKARLTKAQAELRTTEFGNAMEQAIAGDDAYLRTLTDVRYTAECVVDAGGILGKLPSNAPYGRRRKFSNPLFLTPSGYIETYPERDEELFTLADHATHAVRALGVGGEWRVRETLLSMEMTSKRYLRWVAEVKDKEYSEARRSTDELADIYLRGGLSALRTLYSANYVFKIIARLRAQGIEITREDQADLAPRT